MLDLTRFKVYVVGGYVRDRLLGRDPKDHDFVVVGATADDMVDAGFSQVGASFPVFLHPHTGDEYALARMERKVGVGYNGFMCMCDPNITIEEDLYRRDLTINAMARQVVGWNEHGHAKLSDEIIDPYGGCRDLAQGVIRHVSEAFAEDPVRVLRAARFAARYGFKITADTVKLMGDIAPEINHVPNERVWAEFEKGLMEPYVWLMFNSLDDCGAFQRVNALAGYSGWSKLHGISDDAPLYVRFALVSANFTKEMYDECRVPTNVARISQAFNAHGETLMCYLDLPAHDRLALLDSFRAMNDTTLLIQCMDCVWYSLENSTRREDVMSLIVKDLTNIWSVDAAAVAASCKTGLEIKQKLFEARVAAMDV